MGGSRGAGLGAWLGRQGSQGLEVDCFPRDTNVRFSAELRRLQSLPKCERLPLPSFLLLPFQRITRLRMLLQVPVLVGRGASLPHTRPHVGVVGNPAPSLLPGFSIQDPPGLPGANHISHQAACMP